MKNKKMVLWITLTVMAMTLLGCSKKAEAQENPKAGSAKTGAYDSEKDFEIDWDKNVKDGVMITKYIGTKKEVRIPPSIQNNPVTGIGRHAFNYNVTRIIIPDSVTSIGSQVFDGCTSLISVIIPYNVTRIGGGAFESCTSLTSVTFQGKISTFEGWSSPFPGDLGEKYLASDGGPGIYKRFAGGNTWKKQ